MKPDEIIHSEPECEDQPEGFPCRCEEIKERKNQEYEEALVEDIPGISRDMINAGE